MDIEIKNIFKIQSGFKYYLKIYIFNKKVLSWKKKYKTLFSALEKAAKYTEKYLYVLNKDLPPLENSKIENSDYVWQLWFQGWDNAPDIVKICNKSVLKYFGKKVIMLDESNLKDYINIPDYIMEKYKKKQIGPAFFSDYIRMKLLYKYGGYWIDSTILMTDKMPDYISESDFFAFSSTPPILSGSPFMPICSSFFYSRTNGNPIPGYLIQLFEEYTKNEDEVIIYQLIHVFFSLIIKYNKICKEEWEKVPFYSDVPFHVLQIELYNKYSEKRMNQILQMSPLHKLSRIFEFDKEKDSGINIEYIFKTV